MIYTLVGFFLLPHLLGKTLTETMRENYDAELSIEKIEVNPFVLSLRVNGVALDSPEGQPTARLGELFVNFQLSSIFRLAATFDEVRISALELFVTRLQNEEMDFAYLIPASDNAPPPEPAAESEETSLLPLLISRFSIEDFIVHWTDQAPQTPVSTQIGPISVDVEGLNTLPNQSGKQQVVIATENLGTLSWSGDLQLNPFRSSARATLESARFDLVSDYIRHQAGIEITEGRLDLGLDYQVSQTDDGGIQARVDDFSLTINDLAINSFADGTGFDFAGSDQQIVRMPKLAVRGGQIRWPEQTVAVASVSIDNVEIDTARDEQGVFNLEPRGIEEASAESASATNAESAAESEEAPADPWQLTVADLSVNELVLNLLDRSVSPQTRVGVKSLNLNLKEISNAPGARFPMTLGLQAQSGGVVSVKGEVSVLPVPVFDFDVGVEGLQLAVADPYIGQFANLSLQSGAINLAASVSRSEAEAFSYNGNFEIADLLLTESIQNERLASWDRFVADKISFSLAEKRLDISQLQFDQIYGDVLIDERGTLNLSQVARAPADEADPSAETATESATQAEAETSSDALTETQPPEFKVRIGGVVINDASADFADLNLPLPFAVKIDDLNGRMTTISNQSAEPSEVNFEGKVDQYGFARIDGFVTPLAPERNTNIQLSFENIDVPKFTPYTIPFAGREIASGNLDLKLGYQLKDSQLVGDNSIVLRDFELGDEVPHPDALDIPLGLAVALLKDSSGKIDIDLPVSGSVDDPEFSYGGVIWDALGNLLVKIVLSPFSFLGNLLGIEASELENINFLAGRADLTPPEMQRTEKLAEALNLRPELQLVIQGVYDEQGDGLALRRAQVDQQVERRITELTSTSDPEIQYPEHRRNVLEAMLSEKLGAEAAAARLAELQLAFTNEEIVEGQSEPQVSFDGLAYATAINQQLIDGYTLAPDALNTLADSRALALQSALVGLDQSLASRITIDSSEAITPEADKPIQMPVTLNAGS